MDQPYIGQVFMYGFDWAPKNYATCIGQLLAINTNQALFAILGTTFGGNGVNTFGLPDLRGRTHIHWGQGNGLSNYTLGEQLGTQSVTLLQTHLAQHNHTLNVNNAAATSGVPSASVVMSQGPIIDTTVPMYSNAATTGFMNAGELANAGSSQPLSILQPYLAINFSVCLFGVFPSRN